VLAVLFFLFFVSKTLRSGWTVIPKSLSKAAGSGWTARPKSLPIGAGFGCSARPSSFWHDPIVLDSAAQQDLIALSLVASNF